MAKYGGGQLVIPICILTVFYIIVLTPLSLYYLHQLWILSSQNIQFFTKRHSKLIIVSVILFNIYPTILRPFADLTRAYSIFVVDDPLPRSIVNIIQWYLLLQYMRLWLLFFDYNYSVHSLKLKWKEHILKQDTKLPWTHKYKWIGNLKTLSTIALSFGIIFMLIIVGGEIIFGQSFLILMQSVPMICTLFMFIIAFKVRKCRDEFMIQNEFRIYGVSLLLVIILYIIIQLISVAATNLRAVFMNMFTCLCCYIMSFVSTHWVLKQYEKQNKKCKLETMLLHQQSVQETQQQISIRLPLEDILSTKDGFDMFANHLVREFSVENLFYIFEMVQIKNELILHKLIEEKDVGLMFTIDFHRIDRFRRKDSYIYTVDEMKQNIEYIMKQYIDITGEYCINISCNMRCTLQDKYQTLNDSMCDNHSDNEIQSIKKYMEMFDESMDDIITLMKQDSLMRFYSSMEYERLIEQ